MIRDTLQRDRLDLQPFYFRDQKLFNFSLISMVFRTT
jgi:hypothetical protein